MARRPKPRRRRPRRRAGRGGRARGPLRAARWLRPDRLPGMLLWGMAAYLLVLNAVVRHVGGGDVWLLSPSYAAHKSRAVLHLLSHTPEHLLGDAHPDVVGCVEASARSQGFPVAFALAVAAAESSFQPHAVSHAGAMGVMQLMPHTAREMGVLDPFDPRDNARGAVRYLKSLWARYRGDGARVAAAYNLGPGRVPRSGPLSLPGETRHYVRRVLARARR